MAQLLAGWCAPEWDRDSREFQLDQLEACARRPSRQTTASAVARWAQTDGGTFAGLRFQVMVCGFRLGGWVALPLSGWGSSALDPWGVVLHPHIEAGAKFGTLGWDF